MDATEGMLWKRYTSTDNPNGWTFFKIVIAMTSTAGCFVIARLATRFAKMRRFGPEDYFIMIAMVSSLMPSAVRRGRFD